MSVLAIGLNHRTAPLELLERLSAPHGNLPKTLARLGGLPNVDETVVLSTCNRLEVYAWAEKFHSAYEHIYDHLAGEASVVSPDMSDSVYSLYGSDAVRHLYAVVSGLDSVVLGEAEIQGQVKRAWQTAEAAGTSGDNLNPLFRQALGVGRRVRAETELGRVLTSVSEAAVALASQRLGSFAGRRIAVLGAGEMGGGMAKAIAPVRDAELVLASRSWQRAQELALMLGARAVHLDELAAELVGADVLLTSTAATSLVMDFDELDKVMAERGGRDLLVVDIAVPRDVDPSAGALDGLTLCDMSDVRSFAAANGGHSEAETRKAWGIVYAEAERHGDQVAGRDMAPLISEFRRRICDISQAEFERFDARLASLAPEQRRTVEALVHGIVNKVLHEPTVRLKDAAPDGGSEQLAGALRELFDI